MPKNRLDHRAGLPVDGQRNRHHAVVGEQLALAEHAVIHLADGSAVDEHRVAVGEAGHARRTLGNLKDIAVGQNEDVFKRHAQLVRQLRVLIEHAGFAVRRDEELRADERMHQLDLLLRGVSGDMHIRQRGIIHLRAAAVKLVDDLVNFRFITSAERSRKTAGIFQTAPTLFMWIPKIRRIPRWDG